MSKPKKWDLLSSVEQEAWRMRNREGCRKYREENPEKCREQKRKRYESNRDKVRESSRKWRVSNPEKYREAKRKYREANLKKAREISLKSYYKTRKQTAADQFFIMAGAAEQLTKLKPKQ